MALGYRALLRLHAADNAVDLAERQLRDWLRSKERGKNSRLEHSDWDGEGVHVLGANAQLEVTHRHGGQDGSRRRLYRLTESNSGGRFRVSVYAADQPSARDHEQTIIVEAERFADDEGDAVHEISPPRVVRDLLDSARVSDGSTVLTGTPTLIGVGDVHQVVDAIADVDRVASVIVAVSPARGADLPWLDVVESLTKESVGVSAVFVVRADAKAELESLLPESHRIAEGRVRTFAPHVDLDEPDDSVRHLWLGPATLARSISGKSRVARSLQRRHAERGRRRLVELALPSDARRTIDLLRREESRVLRAARVDAKVAESERSSAVEIEEPMPFDTASGRSEVVSAQERGWFQRAAATLRRWVGLSESPTRAFDALDRFIAERVAEIEAANEQLDEAAEVDANGRQEIERLRQRLDELELELTIAQRDEFTSRREATTLRQRIAKGRVGPQNTFVEPEHADWEAPTSVDELVQRITPGEGEHEALRYVEFTGSADLAIAVDGRDRGVGRYAQKFWEYVHVLHDYAQLKSSGEFRGNVHMYLTDDRVVGMKCPPDRHASSESSTVLNTPKWRKERELPVSESVDPSGRVLMGAHFKPTHNDTFAPRMHYFDDVDNSGKVYVGYIGRHLTNTRS